MLKINKDLLRSSNACEKTKSSKYEIEIAYIKNDKELFLVYINQKEGAIRFVLKTQLVTSTDEMIFLLEKYRDFINESLTFCGSKVFGDIIIDKVPSRKLDTITIDKSLSYWKNIQLLEKKIGKNLKFNMPLLDREIEKIDILKNSFIDNKMTVVGNLKNVQITSTNLEQLDKMKGKIESLVLIINNPKDYVCGVNLGKFYKRIEYGPVKLVGYKVLDDEVDNKNSITYKCLLDLEKQKDTKTEVKYFFDKESAKEYKKQTNH